MSTRNPFSLSDSNVLYFIGMFVIAIIFVIVKLINIDSGKKEIIDTKSYDIIYNHNGKEYKDTVTYELYSKDDSIYFYRKSGNQ